MTITSILSIAEIFLTSFIFQKPEANRGGDYHIEFEKIDNRVEVYMGDSLIYDSGIIRKNPKNLQIWVDIDDSLLEYSNELTIKLFNAMEGVPDGADIHWEVKYSIFEGEEVIYWEWYDSNDGKSGIVMEETYILE